MLLRRRLHGVIQVRKGGYAKCTLAKVLCAYVRRVCLREADARAYWKVVFTFHAAL